MELKPGYKQTEVGVIPQQWVETTVGQMIADGLIEKPLDGNHGNIHPKSGDFVDSGIPFVMANNVQDGRVDLVNCSFIRQKQADSLQKGFSRTGDVLLTHKATIGNTAIVGEIPFPYIMLTPQVTYYRVADKEKLSNIFLRYYFDSAGFQSVLRALSGGGTRAYIGISAQHQLPVVVPPNPSEQRAIAEALSDVDELLGGLDRLMAKKRDLKQAAMQQLLTGQTRLPGFHGEWEVKNLRQAAEITTGINKPLSEMGSGALYVTVQDLYAGTSILTNGLSRIKVTEAEIASKALSVGDIVFGKSSVKREGIGYPSQFVGCDEPVVFSGFTYRARARRGISDATFLFYALRAEKARRWVIDNSQASALTNINQSIADAIPIKLPPTVPEQTAIAEVLTDMDAELAALEQRRDKTRALKQAMMQELLTGRIRLV